MTTLIPIALAAGGLFLLLRRPKTDVRPLEAPPPRPEAGGAPGLAQAPAPLLYQQPVARRARTAFRVSP